MHATLRIRSPGRGDFARRWLWPTTSSVPQTTASARVRSIGWSIAAAIWLAIVLFAATVASARIDGDAVIGEPFGIGRVTLTAADAGGTIDAVRLRIDERDGRVHYPAVTTGVVGQVIGQILGQQIGDGPGTATIQFLFRGDAPLRLTVYTPAPHEIVLTPRLPAENLRPRPRLRIRDRSDARLLDRWWREYTLAARRQTDAGDHPPLVQDYLTTMLSIRLGMELPRLVERDATSTQESLELLTGVERLRRQTLRETISGRGDFGQVADLPMPAPPAWRAPQLRPLEGDVEVEPLAMHVPAECFYVRFGKFSNYLWLNKLIQEHGGDLSSMVTLRGYFPPLNDRVQAQLGLEQNKLAELFGDRVIADVCLLGRDTFVQEGAAIGILFQAHSTDVLGNDLTQQRRRALARDKELGSVEETVSIAGRNVSFFSTPDNRLRSFHAVDGDFHLVTTSSAIVERFFAAGEGERALGQSEEFRQARARFQNSREDTIFVYMSAAFFEGLLSPQYQIELKRRLASVTDMEILSLARLAGRGERVASETIEDLTAGGFLPERFGRRPDGSGPVAEEGRMLDSLRGARGTYLPIADVQLKGVTEAEAAAYEASARTYSQSWRQMDPLVVAVKRFALDKEGRERVTIDGVIEPLDDGKYGWLLSILGPPTREMVTPAPGDVINFQAAVRGGLLSPQIPPHHLFLGVQDMPPGGEFAPRGILQTFQMLRGTPGYLGGWPKPGFLDLLPLGLAGEPPDEFGFSRLPLGLWKREGAGFAVLSFDPQLLAEVTPSLRVTDAAEPAQIRVHVGNLAESKLAGWINRAYYQRASEASEGNVRFLHLLNQQLRVPMEDCFDVAEDLLDAKLRCTLRGEYELADVQGAEVWRSTAVAGASPPADYQAPLLTWFRGLDASLIKQDDHVQAHVEIDMQRKPSEGVKLDDLPLLNLFGGASRAFKAKEKKEPAEELLPPLPPVPPEARPRRGE
jgi:hypothetical protein